jgi:hypothetical protein
MPVRFVGLATPAGFLLIGDDKLRTEVTAHVLSAVDGAVT